jgi:hypothetical protein
MAEERETPDRVYIRTQLTRDKVDGYWQNLGFSKEYWMRQCSPAMRYEHVIDYLLRQAETSEQKLDGIKHLEDG